MNDFRVDAEGNQIYLTDIEQAAWNAQRAQAALDRAADEALIATKQADFAELKDTKLQTALTTLGTHQTRLEGSPTNVQVIAAVLYLVKVMIVVIKIVARQVG